MVTGPRSHPWSLLAGPSQGYPTASVHRYFLEGWAGTPNPVVLSLVLSLVSGPVGEQGDTPNLLLGVYPPPSQEQVRGTSLSPARIGRVCVGYPPPLPKPGYDHGAGIMPLAVT